MDVAGHSPVVPGTADGAGGVPFRRPAAFVHARGRSGDVGRHGRRGLNLRVRFVKPGCLPRRNRRRVESTRPQADARETARGGRATEPQTAGASGTARGNRCVVAASGRTAGDDAGNGPAARSSGRPAPVSPVVAPVRQVRPRALLLWGQRADRAAGIRFGRSAPPPSRFRHRWPLASDPEAARGRSASHLARGLYCVPDTCRNRTGRGNPNGSPCERTSLQS